MGRRREAPLRARRVDLAQLIAGNGIGTQRLVAVREALRDIERAHRLGVELDRLMLQVGLALSARQLGIGAVASVAECLDILETLDQSASDERTVLNRLKRLLGLRRRARRVSTAPQ